MQAISLDFENIFMLEIKSTNVDNFPPESSQKTAIT
jgi:hypothetical protein